MITKKKGLFAAVLLCTAGAVANAGVVAEYALSDHPAGDAAPPAYGLRLDNVINPGLAVLSMDHYGDSRLVVSEDAGMLSIRITGTLYGGGVASNAFVNPHTYAVDFTYSVNVAALMNGWDVNTFDVMNSGSLINMDTNKEFDLYGKADMTGLVFQFLADGFRIHGDNSTFVGRGWLTTNADGTDSNAGAQDWLFTGTLVPAPGALALLGLGGLTATRRRR